MLVSIAITLLVFWFLGAIGIYSLGWILHLLLVAGFSILLIKFFQTGKTFE